MKLRSAALAALSFSGFYTGVLLSYLSNSASKCHIWGLSKVFASCGYPYIGQISGNPYIDQISGNSYIG